MPRRFFALLTAFLILFAPLARADLGDVADLAILSQWDERFQDETFRYGTAYFRYGGCGPASVANGIIAALDITDQDQAAGILRDVLYLLTKSLPKKNRVFISHLNYLTATKGVLTELNERYPWLNRAVRDFGGTILYHNGFINAKTLPALLPTANDIPVVIHGDFTSDNRWTTIREVIQTLTDAGYEDARIVLAFLPAGTYDTQSPFRSGTVGHYLSICVPMADFLETGEFYVLDSLPRALYKEAFGQDETFITQYDFAGPQKFFNSLDEFNTLFRVERVTDTIVKPVPIGEALKALNSAREDGAVPLDGLLPYLTGFMGFNGTSHIFITLPAR